MIIVMAKVPVVPGKKTELLNLAKGLMAATQQEDGCVSYVLYDDPNDETCCLFVEEWTDMESLRRHLTTPHIAEWRKQTVGLVAGKSALKIYQGEAVTL